MDPARNSMPREFSRCTCKYGSLTGPRTSVATLIPVLLLARQLDASIIRTNTNDSTQMMEIHSSDRVWEFESGERARANDRTDGWCGSGGWRSDCAKHLSRNLLPIRPCAAGASRTTTFSQTPSTIHRLRFSMPGEFVRATEWRLGTYRD